MSTQQIATDAPAPAPRERRWGGRSISSLILFVLATILLVPALVGHWGHRTVIDSERYIATVGPLIDQPDVQQALATSVTDAVVSKIDTQAQVNGLLNNLFPNQQWTGTLAAPISSGINSLIGDLITKFVASDQFRTVWIGLNTAAQQGVVAILEGRDGGAVQLRGDELVLDTSAALQKIQTYLVNSGITAAGNVTIPDSDRYIVLANTPALAQIRTIYSLTSPILEWLPLLVALMFGGSLLLARRRARTAVALGIVLLASGVVVLLGLNVGETTFQNQLSGTPWGQAADTFWQTLLAYLVAGTQAIVALGIVVIVAGWLAGRTASARFVRGHLTDGLADLGGRLSGGRPGTIPRRYLTPTRVVIYILGVILLLTSDLMSVTTVLWVSALMAGLITLAQLLAGPVAGADASDDGAAVAAAASGGVTTTSTPDTGSITTS
jgi:hypothetical protein